MSSVPDKLDEIYTPFAKEIERLFGKDLISIILFGSAVTGDYMPNKSDLNFLVVLTQKGIQKIRQVQPYVLKWRKKRISVPLFLNEAYIEASLDSFPIEFLNMQSAYLVISGKDVLEKLKINKKDMRLQCEREMKGNLLKLRQGFIKTRGKAKEGRLLVVDSIIAFTSVFRGILFLKGIQIPSTKQEVLLTICREFGLDEGLFSVLLSIKGYATKVSKQKLQSHIIRYISEIEKLTQIVDEMKF